MEALVKASSRPLFKRVGALSLVFVLALAVAGASGAIPDSDDGELHICYAERSTDGGEFPVKAGTVRVIDHQAGKRCERREKYLVINQQGPQGPAGPTGPTGPAGPAGPAGQIAYAEFFALMPPDNAATVAAGADVAFPQDGPTSGTAIFRANDTTFTLEDVGTYRVSFLVSVSEAGQLILTLNGADLPYTVNGRATGTSQIAGEALVETTAVNSFITVRNPSGNSTALTITPLAGGTRPVAASLIIEQLS